MLLPLVATQLLQRMEHVVDNRFIARLGTQALLVHSINFNFFLVAQAVGLAASTSALTFWKRKECARKQKSLVAAHVRASALAAAAVAAAGVPLLPWLVRQYGVAPAQQHAAVLYLGVGLLNMVLAALYAPLNALLIASDQRVKSLVNVGVLILIKMAAGRLAVRGFAADADLPRALLTIGLGGSLAIFLLSAVAWAQVERRAEGSEPFHFSEMRDVWGNEMGTAATRSASPFLYTYFLARSVGGASLLVTYQLTLHLAYILTLPQLAGAQLAIRDASAEQSHAADGAAPPLLEAGWFRWFFAVSVLPTQVLLWLGALAGPLLLKIVYGYDTPSADGAFFSIYLGACAVGQIGNIFLVVLRALRRNAVAVRNFFVAEIGVMVALTGAAVVMGRGTPVVLACIVVAYCAVYLGLNYRAVRAIERAA